MGIKMITDKNRYKKERKWRARDAEEIGSFSPKTEKSQDITTLGMKTYEGSCSIGVCGTEAACRQTQDGHFYYCICPHDASPPTEELKCPNRLRAPQTPKPIHNVIPPNGFNSSASVVPPSASINPPLVESDDLPITTEGGGIMLAASGGAVLALILLTIFLCWIKRRPRCLNSGKAQPHIRPGEPLLADRYVTNPQYGVCSAGQSPSAIPQAEVVDADGATIPLIQRTCLIFLEEVGEGCFGKVHKGMMRIHGSESVVAIKVLKESAGRSAEDDFIREVTIMSAFRHQNILSLIGVVHRDNIGGPCMVFEYMEWGDLAGVLRGDPRGRRMQQSPMTGSNPLPVLSLSALGDAALQVARGMRYLASRRFVHRDLAARNCLVGAGLVVKIADFGMSRDVYTCDYYKMGGERPMPVRWMSPESIVYARFTLESDVWAYGVVLWEIYNRGKQPFYGHNNEGAAKLILRGATLVPPAQCPKFAAELMKDCWKADPRERIGFDEICNRLETALCSGLEKRAPLPRPPITPLDSQGYMVPASPGTPDYLATLPDPESEEDDFNNSEDDDNEDFVCA